MKTSNFVPDPASEAADEPADRLGGFDRRGADAVTAKLNEVFSSVSSKLDPDLVAMQLASLQENEAPGYGNYTEERGNLFKDMSLDDIVSGIEKNRQDE